MFLLLQVHILLNFNWKEELHSLSELFDLYTTMIYTRLLHCRRRRQLNGADFYFYVLFFIYRNKKQDA